MGFLMTFVIAACEKPEESRKITIEDRLIQSFRKESPEVQQQIAAIIRDAQALDYQNAMNKLAVLSATRILTKDEKFAVNSIMRKLRFDMEEEIFSRQKQPEQTEQPEQPEQPE